MSDGEAIDKMGGWIECENCCVSVSLSFFPSLVGSIWEEKRERKRKRGEADAWLVSFSFFSQAHFGCLSETQRVGILKKASADAGEKVRTIKVNQSTVRVLPFLLDLTRRPQADFFPSFPSFEHRPSSVGNAA